MNPQQVGQWTTKLIEYLIENGPKLGGAIAILIAGFIERLNLPQFRGL